LQHVLDALNSALRLVQDRQRRDLDSDDMLFLALTRAIEIAGEAASRVFAETREALPDLPWTMMIAMCNRLVHAYFDVDRDILWTTVTVAAEPVVEKLKTLLDETPGSC
jgi:uncharacterized protein with HEPN domain